MTAPADGRLTSLNSLTTTLAGTEVMYIVSPGNAQLGVSFQITLNRLGTFFTGFPASNTSFVLSGAIYNVKTTDSVVLVNKTVGSATSIVFPPALTMAGLGTVLIKDLKGDAATNNITISFSSGEKIDNLSSIVISNPFGWVRVNPVPNASAWYQS